ncbi:MAG: hypothetical protein WGN25_04410 [Candidatus Electrothrix sp. GW3-4]|uniref:hypothetical protein n=1 Tax=Candidatus Electrothrix sp. GW3-4 TaxID=3126740 RepID=UPI0030D2894B
MATAQYRPEPNYLTTPGSYQLRFVPHNVAGYDELAARLAAKHPGWPADEIKTLLQDANEEIKDMLTNGTQVTLEDAFSYRLSFHARLDAPDDPLPPMDELLRVKVSPSRPFVRAVQQNAHLERLPPKKKPRSCCLPKTPPWS